jgi:hypothetical protein
VIRFLSRRRSRRAAAAPTDPLSLRDPELTFDVAERLVADQKLADAISLLTDANRRRRDPRIEKRLVDLRFEAFKQTDWDDERPASRTSFPASEFPRSLVRS